MRAKVIKLKPDKGWPGRGRPGAAYRVGFWAAVLTVFWILAFNLAAAAGALLKLPNVVVLVVALMIAPPFVVLIAVIHQTAPDQKKVWSLIALSFTLIYATIIIINYFLMLTVVRHNPPALPAFTMDFRPDSAFWALETIGYTFMSLGALFLVPLFAGGWMERTIRWAFIANGAATLPATVTYVITLNVMHPLVILSLAVWGVGFPLAIVLLALLLRRAA